MHSSGLALLLLTVLGPSAAHGAPRAIAQTGKAVDPVLTLQVLLDRAHYSPGEIDGRAGGNTRAAISAYKRQHPEARKQSDASLATSLAGTDAAPILITYKVTEADVAGPFVEIPTDLMDQAKLQALTYSSVLEALGEQTHSSPDLLKRLNPGKAFSAGEEIQIPNVERSAVTKAAKVVVSMSDRSVTALDAQGAIIARYPATLGSSRDPLPLGDWKINGVKRNPTFAYNPDLFWDAKADQAKATIPAGPNSPVGVVWIDLSKESMGIHGTPTPSVVGKTQSHGCIRLTNWDASELAGMVTPGMPATLTR